jgi:hypothetical protein
MDDSRPRYLDRFSILSVKVIGGEMIRLLE